MCDKSKLNQNNISQILTWFKEFVLDKKFNQLKDKPSFIYTRLSDGSFSASITLPPEMVFTGTASNKQLAKYKAILDYDSKFPFIHLCITNMHTRAANVSNTTLQNGNVSNTNFQSGIGTVCNVNVHNDASVCNMSLCDNKVSLFDNNMSVVDISDSYGQRSVKLQTFNNLVQTNILTFSTSMLNGIHEFTITCKSDGKTFKRSDRSEKNAKFLCVNDALAHLENPNPNTSLLYKLLECNFTTYPKFTFGDVHKLSIYIIHPHLPDKYEYAKAYKKETSINANDLQCADNTYIKEKLCEKFLKEHGSTLSR